MYKINIIIRVKRGTSCQGLILKIFKSRRGLNFILVSTLIFFDKIFPGGLYPRTSTLLNPDYCYFEVKNPDKQLLTIL